MGTAVSNTATFRTVQPVVSQTGSGAGTTNQSPTSAATNNEDACPTVSGVQVVEDCIPATTSDLPYTVPMDVTNHAYAAGTDTKNGGLTNDQIKKATRGLSQATAAPADTVTPPVAGQGVALCDPRGYVPSNKNANGEYAAD